MDVLETVEQARAFVAQRRAAKDRIALIPTMGALHDGHLSLLQAADNDGYSSRIVTIFVNPTQFGPTEDFDRYPRTLDADLEKCRDGGASTVFCPSVAEMYPPGDRTVIQMSGLTDVLCGPRRPGHFDGVCTVVTKLFLACSPDAAYFGEKDYQQLVVIRRMAIDLLMPVRVIGCPTVREADGLAMSSRNRYLSAAERARALRIFESLRAGQAMIAAGAVLAADILSAMRAVLMDAAPIVIDYVSMVDPETLRDIAEVDRPVRLAVAVRIGNTRLIDNIAADPPGKSND